MVWLLKFYDLLNIWNPWLTFFNEFFFLQFIIFYFLFLTFSTNNFYFVLFYIFLLFFYFGLFLALLNLDIFTAFLWLTECVVIFVSIIMLFYLNVHNNLNTSNNLIYSYKYFGILIFFFFINLNHLYFFEKEFYIPFNTNINYFYDNYYESLFNNKATDFYGLYNSYYYINSFEYISIGFILLISSLVCVNLNKLNRLNKSLNYGLFLSIFDFFYDFVKFFFLKKQNLVSQNNQLNSLKILKKKFKK